MAEREVVLPRLIAQRAQSQPDALFLQDVAGGSRTYGELHTKAQGWAAALGSVGVSAGGTCLTMLPTSFEAVETWLGIGWLRAIEVPINTAYRGRMLGYVVENSRAEVMVVAERYLDRLAEALEDTESLLRLLVVVGDDDDLVVSGLPAGIDVVTAEQLLASAGAVGDLPEPAPWDIAAILYTSGTTGPSKGVLVPWAQLYATATGCYPLEDLGPDDAYYCPFPLFHVSGKGPITSMAAAGGRVVLREVFDTGSFWKDIEAFGCTTTLLLGAMANFVYRQEPRPDDAATPLRNVLMVPLIPEVEQFNQRFGTRVCTTFNMTEISCPIVSDGWNLVNASSCGRVRPGYSVRVVDEHDQEVPPGQLGELVVRADEPWTLMAGYWGMPDKTVEAWRNQWLHTGDGFTVDEAGNFSFVDRQKDAIRRRGENISSMEVEVEVNEHPDVLESAAIAVPSEWGEDEVKVVAVVKPGRELRPEALIEFLTPRMPRFMVPRYLEFVDELPKTPTEKVRKAQLRETALNERTWDRTAAAAGRGAG